MNIASDITLTRSIGKRPLRVNVRDGVRAESTRTKLKILCVFWSNYQLRYIITS